jgi:N-acetylmuramoyl-L-alanine amidase
VAVEVSGDFSFRTDRLHNPERVYFDIPHARPRIESRPIYSEEVQDPLVRRIRVAETAPDVTRVVLELAAPAEVSASLLVNPSRLMIEVRSAAGPGVPGAAKSEVKTAAKSEPSAPKASPAPAPVKTAPAAPPDQTDGTPRTTQTAKRDFVLPPQPPKTIAVEPLPTPPVISQAAKRTSAGSSSLTRALGLKVTRVVIDPGHGGHDQGTEGPRGLLEKDLVLDVAQRVGALIEDRMGAEVIYTRNDDTYVPLERRTALANEKKADLFLSIHANSSDVPSVAGIETFYLSLTGAKHAMDVAGRENASSENSIFELPDVIEKIIRTKSDKAAESKEFATNVQAALYAFDVRNVPTSKDRGVKTAPFIVLIGAEMPSILAEIGFLTNPREEALLKKPDYRQKLAEALYRGVSRYAGSLSHFETAHAPAGRPAAKAAGPAAPAAQ